VQEKQNKQTIQKANWAWWCTPVISALERQSQEDCKFKASSTQTKTTEQSEQGCRENRRYQLRHTGHGCLQKRKARIKMILTPLHSVPYVSKAVLTEA
jgi:hypothetical protein